MSGEAEPVVLASDQAAPWGVALDPTHVYWTALLDGTVCRVPRAGGEVEVLARGQHGPRGLAVTGDALYWLSSCSGEVMQRRHDDGRVRRLATSPQGAWELALDGDALYWTAPGAVLRVALGGGAPQVIVREEGMDPRALAVDGGEVFWADRNFERGGVFKARTDGTGRILLADCPGGTRALGLAGGRVVWAASRGPVHAVSREGGNPSTLHEGSGHNKALAADAWSVFWADAQAGAIRYARLDGGASGVLAWRQHGPRGLAVDAREVFWADATFGRILKQSRSNDCLPGGRAEDRASG
ncbi:MAG TPA: hypothetical protein VE153_25430 [Myxococcus sp.]|nr:hypothetical protein [Myxococcus sp.]